MWILLIAVFVGYVGYKSIHRPKKFPPGPAHVPVLGYAGFLTKKANQNITDLKKTHGDVIGFNVVFQKIVILNSFEAIRDAYREDSFAGKPTSYLMQLRSQGKYGIVATMGKTWQQNRRATLQILRDYGFGKTGMETTIKEEAAELANIIRGHGGKSFEIKVYLKLVTLNVLWSIISCERINMNDKKIYALHKSLTELHRVASIASIAMFLPWDERIPAWLVGAGQTSDVANEVRGLVQMIVEEHQKTHVVNEETDFIYAFLTRIKSTKDEESEFYGERGLANLANIVSEFFVGGGESTSDTLNWFFMLMCLYPDVQRKIQHEIDTVIGTDRLVSYEDIKSLPYTEAVISETQRFCCIVTTIFHSALRDTEFRGYIIPKGTTLMANLYAVFRDPQLWEKPYEFHPEHFLTDDGHFKSLDHFIPFGIGRRLCIGETIARVQLCLFTTHILQQFTLAFPAEDPLPVTETDSSFFRIAPHYRIVAKARHA
nr:CYP370C9 protein [Diaphanosoma celebensis]